MGSDCYIGLISGTSRDGVDAALVDFSSSTPKVLASSCTPFTPALKQAVDHLIALGRRPQAEEYHSLDLELGECFASAANALLENHHISPAQVQAVGSHGQTVWHEPTGEHAVSLQLGAANIIAQRTGLTAVSDFRTADLNAGGEGAPLAPLLHQALFSHLAPCAVLNLGGIGNLTWLDQERRVSGFDTGPANCLMDAWCARHRGEPFDRDGSWAAGGQILVPLLERMLQEPYFAAPPPKSTGLELFNLVWLESLLPHEPAAPQDVQRTLLELTVQTIARDLNRLGPPDRLLVCGGGIHNGALMNRLQHEIPDLIIESTQAHGVDPDWVEAMLFAWLARERLGNRKIATGPITGAHHPVLLGTVSQRGSDR